MSSTFKAFTSSGTFVVPAGISALRVFGVGGGGSGGGGGGGNGGGGTSDSGVGGAGGGAAIAREESIIVTPGISITVSVATVVSGGAGSVSNTTPGSDGSNGNDTSLTWVYQSSSTSITFAGAECGRKGPYGADLSGPSPGTAFSRGGDPLQHSNTLPSYLDPTLFTGTTSFLYLPKPGQGGWGLPQDLTPSSYTSWLRGGHHGANNYGVPGSTSSITDGGAGGGGGGSNWFRRYGFVSTGGNGGNGGSSGSQNGTAGSPGTYGSGGGGGGGGYGSAAGGGGTGGAGGAGGAGLVIISWVV
jgi:hypothetical protein